MRHLHFLRLCSREVHCNLLASKKATYVQLNALVQKTNHGRQLRRPFSSREWIDRPQNCIRGSYERGLRYCSSLTAGDQKQQRIDELRAAEALKYPRIQNAENPITCADFIKSYSFVKPDHLQDGEIITLRGRIHSLRVAGSRLMFIDVMQDGSKVQCLCNLGRLQAVGVGSQAFRRFCHLVRRGDIISITGTPCRTDRGQLSLNASKLPTVLSPILASLPSVLEDQETRIRSRHADMLVNPKVAHILRLRSHIIQYLRSFLFKDSFLEVQTPILADGAGGAIARPFLTSATEFQGKQLSLRIAPEIWLKRLVLGGMDRVFEIGPAFRNEGLDATHNPEFTTCEFYKSFANLEELIAMTESLISEMAVYVDTLIESQFTSLDTLDLIRFSSPFKRIEFIPALEAAIGRVLPDLASEQAYDELVSLFFDLKIPLPSSRTVPRLLDKLSSRYLETQCTAPTFIIHPPACLAPLAKSFYDLSSKQVVSARAELFVHSHEVANMYEEENSPFEQRKKFVQQAKWQDEENVAATDENYLEALAWALPPTGGWGCGVERLCMLFSGSARINDVLSFGNLRNVVGLGQGHKDL